MTWALQTLGEAWQAGAAGEPRGRPCTHPPAFARGLGWPRAPRVMILPPAQKKGSKLKKAASVEEGDEELDSPGGQSRGSVPSPEDLAAGPHSLL